MRLLFFIHGDQGIPKFDDAKLQDVRSYHSPTGAQARVAKGPRQFMPWA